MITQHIVRNFVKAFKCMLYILILVFLGKKKANNIKKSPFRMKHFTLQHPAEKSAGIIFVD